MGANTVRKSKWIEQKRVYASSEEFKRDAIQHKVGGFAYFFVYIPWGSQGWYKRKENDDIMR